MIYAFATYSIGVLLTLFGLAIGALWFVGLL